MWVGWWVGSAGTYSQSVHICPLHIRHQSSCLHNTHFSHTPKCSTWPRPHPCLLGGDTSDSGGSRRPALLNDTEVHKVSRVVQSEMPHLTTPSLLLSVCIKSSCPPQDDGACSCSIVNCNVCRTLPHAQYKPHHQTFVYLTHNYTVVSARASSPIHILHTAISHVIKVMERQFLSHAITIGIHVNCFDHTQCAVCKWTKKACKRSTVCNAPIGDLTQLPTFNHLPWHSLSLVFHMVYCRKSWFGIY